MPSVFPLYQRYSASWLCCREDKVWWFTELTGVHSDTFSKVLSEWNFTVSGPAVCPGERWPELALPGPGMPCGLREAVNQQYSPIFPCIIHGHFAWRKVYSLIIRFCRCWGEPQKPPTEDTWIDCQVLEKNADGKHWWPVTHSWRTDRHAVKCQLEPS